MEDQIGSWISLALSAIALGTVVWGWFTAGGSKAMAKVDALDRRLDAELKARDDDEKLRSDGIVTRFQLAENRVQWIEGEIKHMPDAQAVNELQLSISELRGSMNVQGEVMSNVSRTVARLETYLLEKGK